jgi:hypothetical protein
MQTTLDRFFQADKGNIVITQLPNILITVWAISSVLKLVVNNGNLSSNLDAISFGSIAILSLMELFQGIDTFRRTLGLVTLIASIFTKFVRGCLKIQKEVWHLTPLTDLSLGADCQFSLVELVVRLVATAIRASCQRMFHS